MQRAFTSNARKYARGQRPEITPIGSGLPYPGNAFRVVDINDATFEMPRGQLGELMSSGPLVVLGYHNNPAAEAVRPDGWLHTGDIAVMDDDGYATIVDRKKDMA